MANKQSTSDKEEPKTVKTKRTPDVQTVEMKRRQLVNRYRQEPKVGVSVSPMYRPYFGRNMHVSINGIAVYVPCDGKTYKIPRPFAVEVMSRVSKVDEMLTRKERMTSISNNVESSPGELKFF